MRESMANRTLRGAGVAPVTRLLSSFLPFLFLFLFCAFGSAAAVGDDDGGYALELVQILHRHGARAPIISFNESLICKSAPCGYLNDAGKKMMVNLGKFMRKRYNEEVASGYFADEYNVSEIYTRSTDVLRTLQSASGVLKGLFTNASDDLFAIHTLPKENDVLLASSALPALYVREAAEEDLYVDAVNARVDELFTKQQVQDMAAEAHMDKYCAAWEKRVNCVKKLRGAADSYYSTGEISDYPLLSQHYENLGKVAARANVYWFAYNKSEEEHRMRGSYGINLATELVDNMKARVKGDLTFSLMHYSAHDTTVTPLSTSLGDNSEEAMMPPYGTTYFFELLRSSSTKTQKKVRGASDYSVRIMWGHPNLAGDSDYEFSAQPFDKMQCMRADGTAYTATNAICPLNDFERFVRSSAPASPSGACYLTASQRASMQCPADDSDETPNEVCTFFRSRCPKEACDSGRYLTVGTADGKWQCRSIGSGVEVGVSVAVALVALMLGMVLSFALSHVSIPQPWRKKDDRYTVLEVIQ